MGKKDDLGRVEAGVNRTVLIVDDSASMRQIVRLTLEGVGFAIVEGSNGQEGLDQLRAHRVQAIISDVNMPVMDGISLVRLVRGLQEYRSLPILLMTTASDASRKNQGRVAGANGWIVKPFSPAQLLETLDKVLVKSTDRAASGQR
ncbi:MAG: response regulator [Polyangiaceae bacterium]